MPLYIWSWTLNSWCILHLCQATNNKQEEWNETKIGAVAVAYGHLKRAAYMFVRIMDVQIPPTIGPQRSLEWFFSVNVGQDPFMTFLNWLPFAHSLREHPAKSNWCSYACSYSVWILVANGIGMRRLNTFVRIHDPGHFIKFFSIRHRRSLLAALLILSDFFSA